MRLFRTRGSPEGTRPQWQPIPAWSWMLTAVLAVALTAFVITAWLLTIASHATPGTDEANARLDAVRTGLAAGAGAGAAVGLMLAFRRQHHQEISTALTDHDATERRITELYTRAVEQLGNEKAPVRLGGLYALERLAQNNHEQRQTIVNVICAYLRMPFLPEQLASKTAISLLEKAAELNAETTATSVAPDNTWQQERQVRLTAQRILSEHLRKPDTGQHQDFANHTLFWDQIRLDLTGATLINFNLADSMLSSSLFSGATFNGDAVFGGATFNGDAGFDGATFSGLIGFGGATFNGDARFRETTFNGVADFDKATFNGDAGFDGATFSAAGFDRATFNDDAGFYRATFNGLIGFGGATFNGDAGFGQATFNREAQFGGASFNSTAGFHGATFSGYAKFVKSDFSTNAWFSDATFNGDAEFVESGFKGIAGFGKSHFRDNAWFSKATFNGDAGFDGATFKSTARFDGATFKSTADFRETTFGDAAGFRETTFGDAAVFRDTTFNLGPDAASFVDAVIRSPDSDHVWPKGWQLIRDGTGLLTVSRTR